MNAICIMLDYIKEMFFFHNVSFHEILKDIKISKKNLNFQDQNDLMLPYILFS